MGNVATLTTRKHLTVDNLYAFIPLARFSGHRLFWSFP